MTVNGNKVYCVSKRFIQVNELPVFQLVLSCGRQSRQYFANFDSFTELQEYADFLERNPSNAELPDNLRKNLQSIE